MDNDQKNETNHQFAMNSSSDKRQQSREKDSLSLVNSRSSLMQKSSWQIGRDRSMELLSRKTSRLSFKQESIPRITSPRSLAKTYASRRSSSLFPVIQTYCIPRMPTEKESTQVAISYETSCSFCENTCLENYLRCRICPKAYHSDCLIQRGYLTEQSTNKSRTLKQEWSCPQCSDLTQLLTQDELDHLIYAFDQIDCDRDGYILLEEFLSLKSNKKHRNSLEFFIQHNIDVGKKIFSIIDSSQKGVIAWSDFVLFYTCKFLAIKDKTELTTKLTKKELVTARKFFLSDTSKTFDNNYNIIITRDHFNQIYNEQILTLKKKYGFEFLDVILTDHSYYYENHSEKNRYLKWSEFLRDLTLLFLLNRSNDDIIYNQTRRASIPPHLIKASIVSRSKYSSIIETNLSQRYSTLSNSLQPDMILSCDEIFRKHAKILDRLNHQYHEENLRKKELGSDVSYSIVESLDEDETQIHLPKLKLNRRDDRRTITDPWTSVKQIEQIRTQPIFIKKHHPMMHFHQQMSPSKIHA